MKTGEKTTLVFFVASVFFILTTSILNSLGLSLMVNPGIFYWFVMLLPVVTLISHSLVTQKLTRTLIIFLIPAILGFFFEYFGMQTGVIFGSHYQYSLSFQVLFSVPYVVIAYWAVFYYSAYAALNSIWTWFGYRIPTQNQDKWRKILPLVLIDILLVVCIDLLMDPVFVYLGK